MCFINCTQRQIDYAVGHLLYISGVKTTQTQKLFILHQPTMFG